MKISKLIVTILILASLILIDQYTKIKVVDYFSNSNYDYFRVNSYLNIVLVHNRGITFGIFSNLKHSNMIFLLITILIIIYLFTWMKKNKFISVFIALNFVIAGAIGNLIDRVRWEAVVDFLDFHYNKYHWYSFNIADSCICIGVFILLIKNLESESKIKKV